MYVCVHLPARQQHLVSVKPQVATRRLRAFHKTESLLLVEEAHLASETLPAAIVRSRGCT